MGSRNGLGSLLRVTVRIAAATERDRKRAVNGYQAQARRQQRTDLAQKSLDSKTAEKLAKAEYLAGQQEKVDDLNAAMQDRLANL